MSREKILVIDDSMTVRRLLFLALPEWDVEGAGSGTAGLEIARVRTPRLIFLDEMLPDIKTVDVLAAFQESPALKDVPVVLLTEAGRDPLPELKARFPNTVGVLRKPFALSEAVEQVESVLQRTPIAPEVETPTSLQPEQDQRRAGLIGVLRSVLARIPAWEASRGEQPPESYYSERILSDDVVAALLGGTTANEPTTPSSLRPLAIWDRDEADVCLPLRGWCQRKHRISLIELAGEADRLACLVRERPQIVLLDSETAGEELVPFTKSLSTTPETADVRIVVTCETPNPEQIAEWKVAGATAVLVKPFRTQELESCLAAFSPTH